MVNIAVAGGAGGVGRTIVDALKADGKHEVIILTRKIPDNVDLGVPVIAVDYDDVDALQAVLEEHRIETVISALALHIIGVGKSQINLIKAAEKSSSTKRFVTSTWGVRASTEYFAQLPHGFQHIDSYAELDKTGLEWTAFNLGYFIDYYAMPHVDTRITPQTTFVVDMVHKHAAIPGNGKQPITFTYSKDAAKFVVAALDLPKWERDTYIIGEKMTWEELVKVAEQVRGEKFTVVYDSVEMLKSGKITELPGHVDAYSYFPKEWTQRLYSAFGYWTTEGVFDLPDNKALNHQFPGIKVTTVKEMLDKAWRGK